MPRAKSRANDGLSDAASKRPLRDRRSISCNWKSERGSPSQCSHGCGAADGVVSQRVLSASSLQNCRSWPPILTVNGARLEPTTRTLQKKAGAVGAEVQGFPRRRCITALSAAKYCIQGTNAKVQIDHGARGHGKVRWARRFLSRGISRANSRRRAGGRRFEHHCLLPAAG